MMTKAELRVLYLLFKADKNLRLSEISQQMHRTKAADRLRALAALEDMDLISSAQVSTKGRTPTVYWLTPTGKDCCKDLIERGDMVDPQAA